MDLADLSKGLAEGLLDDAKVSDAPARIVSPAAYFEKAAGGNGMRAWHWISAEEDDRSGDVVRQKGIDFADWERTGAPWLFAHGYRSLPIGRSVEHGVKRRGGSLRAYSVLEFYDGDNEMGEFCRTLYDMTVRGFLLACSISGRIKEWTRREEGKPALDIKRLSLYEVSKVSIPDQPAAVADMKAAGINLTPLFGWWMREIEEAQKSAAAGELPGIYLEKARAEQLAQALGLGSAVALIEIDADKLAELRSDDNTEEPRAEFSSPATGTPNAPILRHSETHAVDEPTIEASAEAAVETEPPAAEPLSIKALVEALRPVIREEIERSAPAESPTAADPDWSDLDLERALSLIPAEEIADAISSAEIDDDTFLALTGRLAH